MPEHLADVMVKMQLDRPVALFNLHAYERLHETSSSDVEIPRVLLHELVLKLVVGGDVHHVSAAATFRRSNMSMLYCFCVTRT
jgi:hypothetical protein